MTTIFECDGCGETTKRIWRIRPVTVQVTPPTQAETPIIFYGHLCSTCERELKERADPKKWVRLTPEKRP